MYAYISDQYLHVLQVLDHWGMETTTESPKHLLVTPHPGGPTQGTPGHVPNHFLTPSQSPPSTRFFDFFWENQCLDLSCHGHRNGQGPPEGPKLCPVTFSMCNYMPVCHYVQVYVSICRYLDRTDQEIPVIPTHTYDTYT